MAGFQRPTLADLQSGKVNPETRRPTLSDLQAGTWEYEPVPEPPTLPVPTAPKLPSPVMPTLQAPIAPNLPTAEISIPQSKISPALPTPPKPTVGQFAGRNITAGLSGFNKGLAQTADWLLPTVLPAITLGMFDADTLNSIQNPIQKGFDYYKSEGDRYAREAQETNTQLGKSAEIGGQLIQGTVGAVPNAVLATMSAGASTAPQIATAAPKAATLLNTIGTSTKELAKNPMFWTSFARTAGGTYEQAKEEGANELQAQATAIISGMLNAGVEVGGGLEVLPANVKKGGQSAIRAWVNSMIDEGKEEVITG